MRDGFILHTKTMDMIECMDADTLKEFMTAMIAHFRNEEVDIESLAARLAYIDAKERMDADAEAYESVSEKRSAAGKKGAEARWSDSKAKANDGKRMAKDGNAMANDCKRMANDSVSVSVSVLKEKDNTSYYPKRNADCEALPLNDGTEWRPTEDEFNEFIRIYPAVNVRQEFASMRGWLIGNPTKRKTNRGIKRFVTSWLSRAQDKPKPTTNKWSAKVEQREYDMDDLEARIMAVQ